MKIKMGDDTRMMLVVLAIGIVATVSSIKIMHQAEQNEKIAITDLDRGIAVEELNNYSKYSGWQAEFSFENRTLLMTGFMLCGRDFLSLIPKGAKNIIVSNFTWFRCSHGNTRAVIRLHED